MMGTGRLVDPLNPVYSLPSAPAPAVAELPFKRDSHLVDDIEGSKPK